MDLKTSTFIVTGGASGLGEATVRTLHAGGANVVIADLQADEGEALAKELGAKARFVKCDVTSEADGKAAVELAVKTFGGLQGLVNCAGIAIGEKTIGKEGPHALGSFAKVDDRQPDRHVQHDPARRGCDGQGRAERRRRARRDREHRLGRGVRRPDRAGRPTRPRRAGWSG